MSTNRTEHRFWVSIGLLVGRVAAAGLLIYGHGWAKLVHFSETATTFPDPLGLGAPTSLALAVFAEAICAVAVLVGLGTRLACVPIVFEMLVAALQVHRIDPWQQREVALVYAVPFLMLIFTGPGRFSLDTIVWPKLKT